MEGGQCRYCKRLYNYFPDDLIQIFGDVDVDSLAHRMNCENGRDKRSHRPVER